MNSKPLNFKPEEITAVYRIIKDYEENIPEEYQGEELARAYELLAKADVFKGRIYKQQYWRFLVYENFFLSYGMSSAKKTPNPNRP